MYQSLSKSYQQPWLHTETPDGLAKRMNYTKPYNLSRQIKPTNHNIFEAYSAQEEGIIKI